MEFSFLFMHPLPPWLPWIEAIELKVNVLIWATFDRTFISVTNTSEIDDLLLAYFLHLEFYDLVYSCALLTSIGNLALPQMHTVEFEVTLVHFLKFLHSRVKLVLEFEEDMFSESLTQHRECLQKSTVEDD